MKKTAIIIGLITITICFTYSTIFGAVANPDIMRVMLTDESTPPEMKIAQEVWASPEQLLQARLRIGFTLNALLNQLLVYDTEQAQVNYLMPPERAWFEFGYSKLTYLDGKRSMILTKGDVIEQVAATSKVMEDLVIRLLDPDLVHQYKIRGHRLPKNWSLTSERFMESDQLRTCERAIGRPLRYGISQEFMVDREKLWVSYYECDSEDAAEELARYLAGKIHPLNDRVVEWNGPVVAAVESQRENVNEDALSLMNW